MSKTSTSTTETGGQVHPMVMPILCYIDGPWAYFTTQPLADQWGDDWDDAPYEHNAGTPYGPCWHRLEKDCWCDICKHDWNPDHTPKWEIIKVAYDGDFETPDVRHSNSPYSVEKINAGAVAWLVSSQWSKKQPLIAIYAGTTLEDFKRLVVEGGGRVFLPA